MALEFLTEASRTTVHRVLTQHLNLRKVSARWVPRDLSETHRSNRMAAALDFLTRYEADGAKFLNRIVTGDETWIHFWTPETKRASMVWKTVDEPAPKKFKEQPSAGKVMVTVFWDTKGIIMVEYMPQGSTITAASYFDTLMRLRKAIKEKRRGKLSKKIVLLHDNARPHSAKLTQTLLRDVKWDVFPHPPYSPDLAPSDFHLFPAIKAKLAGQRFPNLHALTSELNNIFKNLEQSFYSSGIEKLVVRYNKCLDKFGDYVEK